MNSEKYIYPTRRAQIIVLIWIVSFGFIYFLIPLATELVMNELEINSDIGTAIIYLIALNSVMAILFLFICFWWLKIGLRTINENQIPPTGFLIIIRTEISRGKLAITQGIICFAASLMMLIVALCFIYIAWSSYGI